jgi:hypothetical protein
MVMWVLCAQPRRTGPPDTADVGCQFAGESEQARFQRAESKNQRFDDASGRAPRSPGQI